VLRELISIFQDKDPLAEAGESFARMLRLTQEMNFAAGEIFFGERREKTQRERIYERDTEVNALEQKIRRWVMTHLSVPGSNADLPYSLLLISLVKDVERLGDYAKNLSEIVDIRPDPLPDGPALVELMMIRRRVELSFQSSADVFEGSRKEEAAELIKQARETARRCDQLISEIGHSDYDAATTTAFILGTRYYKRIGAHVLNVLSSVVMPLDKVDYYDEPLPLPPNPSEPNR
jgi:phosphate uptake regulator